MLQSVGILRVIQLKKVFFFFAVKYFFIVVCKHSEVKSNITTQRGLINVLIDFEKHSFTYYQRTK